ncbi:MAG: ABC transporter permease [Pseudomonadales bacterium]
MVIAPLDRKLLRDLWRVRGQALAISLIVASGVAVLVMSMTAMQALDDSSRAYYDRARFADVFAWVKRAPRRLLADIAAIDGVQMVEARIAQFALLDMPGLREPVTGRLVSIPDAAEPALNRVQLRSGRLPDPLRRDEVVVSEPFAEAHRLRPGSRFGALLNGRQRSLTVVGVGLSPEFVYAIGPGALMPDPEHFGVIWVREAVLAAAFGLDGAFNDVLLLLYPGVPAVDVLTDLDAILAPYGGIGGYDRSEQISHWFLANEIAQLQTLARILPAVFLLVAAYLTNMVLARLVYLERAEIGLLKAFGYGNGAVVWHYAKMVVVLSLIGLLLGWVIGQWLGHWMTAMYAEYFRIPELTFRLQPWVFALSAAVSVGASLIGVVSAARYAGALPPAEAMRPPQPPMFRHRLAAGRRWLAGLDQPTRIIVRQLLRRPGRSLLTSLGLGAGVGLLVVSLQWFDALDHMIEQYFERQQRQDMTLVFADPKPASVLRDVARLPGVLAVEPARSAAARFTVGHRSHREALVGLPAAARLTHLNDAAGRPVMVPPHGMLLTDMLAGKLGVVAGDRVQVQLLEGRRQRIELPVSGIFESPIGMAAYVDLDAFNRALLEPGLANMLQLVVDRAEEAVLYAALQGLAPIAGVTLKRAATDKFEETIGETMLVMVFFYLAFAGTMAFGMVYNNLRIALSERGRELATLRVLGFRPGEVSYMLFGEAGMLMVLALPLGCAFGWLLATIMAASFETELFRIPVVIEPSTYALAVVLTLMATLPSVLLVQRRLQRLDLIAVLKTRE